MDSGSLIYSEIYHETLEIERKMIITSSNKCSKFKFEGSNDNIIYHEDCFSINCYRNNISPCDLNISDFNLSLLMVESPFSFPSRKKQQQQQSEYNQFDCRWFIYIPWYWLKEIKFKVYIQFDWFCSEHFLSTYISHSPTPWTNWTLIL